jgi:3-oxoacyl-[acyl-carrier protein] reductase
MQLQGKVAFVTGVGTRISDATATLFAKEGASVALVGIDKGAVDAVAASIACSGGRALPLLALPTSSQDMAEAARLAVAEFGPPTVLFTNSHVHANTEGQRILTEISEVEFDGVVAGLFKGAWMAMRHVVPSMRDAGGGAIVNCSSVASQMASNSIGYSAGMAGILGMTRVAAVEFAEFGIRVNALCAGATPETLKSAETYNATLEGDELTRRVSLLGRLGEAEDMAKMALFLASDSSSFATGASFVNDGGWSAKRSYNAAG